MQNQSSNRREARMIIHPPGVYLRMPPEEYHADPSLGSTDLRNLRKGARRYWLASSYNPERHRFIDEDRKSTVVGSAIHCRVLDGLDVFLGKYVRRPDDTGASSGDKAKATKAFKAQLMSHQILLNADDWSMVEAVGDLITAHPDLRNLFTGGDHEVSVFWVNEHGIPCKARFDVLKPRGIADLKSVANERGMKFDIKCMLHIRDYRYDIQAAHYLEGRRQLAKLVADEKVFASQEAKGTSVMKRMIAVASESEFAFQLVFVSKQLPETWACVLSPENPLIEIANEHVLDAFEVYLDNKDKILDRQGWSETWRLSELPREEIPGGERGWN